MNDRLFRALTVLLACALAAATPLAAAAQSKKPAKKGTGTAAASAAPATPPRILVAVDSLFDRRTTRDFPGPQLSITLKLEGEDAPAVLSARANITRAVDDTGRNLAEAGHASMQASDGWKQAGEGGAPSPTIELPSPSRKAKTLTAVEGVVQAYLPSRDPAATVKIERVSGKKDRPLAVPALASQRVRLQVLSKAGLEKEKAQAQAKKKAEAAKKKGTKGKKEGLEGVAEGMAEGMADVLVNVFEKLFSTAGENDLILKVDDPGKKIFSFDLAGPDGAPLHSYGTTDLEGYRIVRMLEPIPEGASLQVRLKTARSFGEVSFTFSNLKLP